ncbi:hypothetical protein PGT21_032834 [Puccinia graminis f. sp. tritici]|uniref:Uncharacterized protein n=1 Tax=Puccinia graminis f. sp. tritici TaxID=56615 RepID=A0A5B0MYS3_PUCGR|nr:hypothetical protein PGT21_032834 [Puccinia graminis f. sp. tritici]KAA1130226.1 hypothetical protein PGTUg99_013003 [Puccinia graminis f. sp. tritici]
MDNRSASTHTQTRQKISRARLILRNPPKRAAPKGAQHFFQRIHTSTKVDELSATIEAPFMLFAHPSH